MRVRFGPRYSGGALIFALFCMSSSAASAQIPTLDRVDSLVAAGDYDVARTSLTRWWSARDQFDVPGSDMARALMLRAQLAPDPGTAEPDYLAVVLGYPTSDHAPEALLRLGQGLLATGDAARSAAYLGRLVADYPGRPQRLPGLLWLARANSAARRPAAACTAARQGLQDARDPDLAAMLRVEAAAACSIDDRNEPAGQAAVAGSDVAGVEAPSSGVHDAAAGDWAVQSGAFRNPASADRLMQRLREAGYSPRIVRVPRNDLLRVRIGRFTSSEEATALVTRLREGGFDAVPVKDAAQERKP